MDLEKIRVRQDLERMVVNYFLMGKISEEQSAKITDYVDNVIGGGCLPEPGFKSKTIIFPTAYTGPAKHLEDFETENEKEPAKETIIEAPYGSPLPDCYPDFRKALQRDGLLLILWEKLIGKEGTFYNVLWAKSCGGKRYTSWSGNIREEEIPYVMPDDNTGYSYNSPKLKTIYTVKVAPENVLHGPIAELPKYVQSLKDFGIKVDFEYNFNFAAEKRTRFLEKNKELIPLNIAPRVLTVLNDMEIFTVKALQKITVKKLRSMKGLGNATIQEFLSVLEKQNIFLQEDQENYV
jgi:hypothetical protein